EAECKRAFDLSCNLLWVDHMAAIGGCDDPVDLHLAVHDRDFSCCCHIAAIAMMLADAAEYTFRCRLVPFDTFCNGVEHAEMQGVILHHCTTELVGVLASSMGHLIHEGLEIECVLVVVDPAPVTWTQRRLAQRMIDEQVGDF